MVTSGAQTMLVLRFLALVLVLNVLRYIVGAWLIEGWLIFPGLFGAMQDNASYFNTDFTTFDWITSYLYNFMMWLTCVWVFHLMRPAIRGMDLVASFKVFGIMWLFFAAVSAIYMNHYSHARDFYAWNILDGLLMYALVAVGTGLLYRPVMGPHARGS